MAKYFLNYICNLLIVSVVSFLEMGVSEEVLLRIVLYDNVF